MRIARHRLHGLEERALGAVPGLHCTFERFLKFVKKIVGARRYAAQEALSAVLLGVLRNEARLAGSVHLLGVHGEESFRTGSGGSGTR